MQLAGTKTQRLHYDTGGLALLKHPAFSSSAKRDQQQLKRIFCGDGHSQDADLLRWRCRATALEEEEEEEAAAEAAAVILLITIKTAQDNHEGVK